MSRLRIITIIFAGAFVLVSILACSAGGGDDTGGTGTDAGPVATVTQQGVPAPTGPFTAFRDGQYEVGNQPGMIKPGKYRTTVPANSINCYWERRSNLAGDLEGIIANGNHKPGSPIVLTIAATDKGFNTSGCGEWRLSP